MCSTHSACITGTQGISAQHSAVTAGILSAGISLPEMPYVYRNARLGPEMPCAGTMCCVML